MTYYVQRKDGKALETVDEFETYKEAKAMVTEYRLCLRLDGCSVYLKKDKTK